jgi:hypothetical protein
MGSAEMRDRAIDRCATAWTLGEDESTPPSSPGGKANSAASSQRPLKYRKGWVRIVISFVFSERALMTMKVAPPGRTSSSATGVVYGFGGEPLSQELWDGDPSPACAGRTTTVSPAAASDPDTNVAAGTAGDFIFGISTAAVPLAIRQLASTRRRLQRPGARRGISIGASIGSRMGQIMGI